MTLEEKIFELELSLDYHMKSKDAILKSIEEGWGTQEDLENSIKTIAHFKQELEWLRALKEIWDSGDCNNCLWKGKCNIEPKLGQLVRYNCYAYARKQEVKADEDGD